MNKSQTEIDGEKAKRRVEVDSKRAADRTRQGSQEDFELNRRNIRNDEFNTREFNAGLNLAGGDSTSGRDFYKYTAPTKQQEVIDWGLYDDVGVGGGGGSSSSGDTSGGGGISGFSEEKIQYIDTNNAAKEKTFLVK